MEPAVPPSSSGSTTAIVVAIIIVVVLLLVIVAVVIFTSKKRRGGSGGNGGNGGNGGSGSGKNVKIINEAGQPWSLNFQQDQNFCSFPNQPTVLYPVVTTTGDLDDPNTVWRLENIGGNRWRIRNPIVGPYRLGDTSPVVPDPVLYCVPGAEPGSACAACRLADAAPPDGSEFILNSLGRNRFTIALASQPTLFLTTQLPTQAVEPASGNSYPWPDFVRLYLVDESMQEPEIFTFR